MPFCHLVLTASLHTEPYPKEINTLGDHLRKKRLDLKLRQTDVADRLGVDEMTIVNWELGKTHPRIHLLPRITELLGYCPYQPIASLSERLRAHRRALGLSRRKAARVIGVDESTLARWETGERRPEGRYLKLVACFLGAKANS